MELAPLEPAPLIPLEDSVSCFEVESKPIVVDPWNPVVEAAGVTAEIEEGSNFAESENVGAEEDAEEDANDEEKEDEGKEEEMEEIN